MTKKEIEKLSKLFKESCISAWTSERFQIPAITKTEAEIRWLEISVLFASAVYELLEDKKKKKGVNKMKQIDIKELISKMNPGYVTCDKDGTWNFWTTLPYLENHHTYWQFDMDYITEESEAENLSVIFNIAPAEDWTKSLIKIERK